VRRSALRRRFRATPWIAATLGDFWLKSRHVAVFGFVARFPTTTRKPWGSGWGRTARLLPEKPAHAVDGV
jgi:hypothetical protein